MRKYFLLTWFVFCLSLVSVVSATGGTTSIVQTDNTSADVNTQPSYFEQLQTAADKQSTTDAASKKAEEEKKITQDAALKAAKEKADALAESNVVAGMTLGPVCLKNGQCGFSIYRFLGIRKSVEGAGKEPASAGLFVQDIVLAATFFIGTIVSLGIVFSGLSYIFAAASGQEPTKAAAGLKNSFIGLLLVIFSYAIIRLVQYLAKGV